MQQKLTFLSARPKPKNKRRNNALRSIRSLQSIIIDNDYFFISQVKEKSGILPEQISAFLLNHIKAHLFSPLVETVCKRHIHIFATFGTYYDCPLAFVLIVKGLPDERRSFCLILLVKLFSVSNNIEYSVRHRV
jgi:hypothetical protein